jgi:serine/threonine protein phosphatase PrpC
LSKFYGKHSSTPINSNNPTWRMTTTTKSRSSSRRKIGFPFDDMTLLKGGLLFAEATENITITTTTRKIQDEMLRPQQQQQQQLSSSSSLSSGLTVAGMIPIMRQFQHRSISFWSWRGGEESDDDTTVPAVSTIKATKNSNSNDRQQTQQQKQKQQERRRPSRIQVSYSTEQGFRSYMEDEFFISDDGDFCCCFDGHGGRAVSRYLKKNLYANVQAFLPPSVLKKNLRATATTSTTTTKTQQDDNDIALIDETQAAIDGLISTVNRSGGEGGQEPTVEDYATALASALDKIDKEILRISHWSFQGSTAVVVWILQDVVAEHNHKNDDDDDDDGDEKKTTKNQTILVANIGDSRAVLCRSETAYELTRDHKPSDPNEKQRIEGLGGSVIWCGDVDYFGNPIKEQGIYRVNGNLALSRAIGDRAERPHVSASPDMVAMDVQEGDEFIILATDGLWDVMDSSEAVSYVKFVVEAGLSKEKVASQVVQEALRRGTFDNITVLVIWL